MIVAKGMRASVHLAKAVVVIAAAASLLLLAGCFQGTRGGPVPYDVANFGRPDSPVILNADADYKIAPMDTVRVSVFQVGDLSGDFEVDLMGNITLPLAGTIRAADLTTTQLDKVITAKLSEKYLQDPDVAVALRSSARRNVTIDGAVNSPGQLPLNGPTTLIQALAMARGLSGEANPHRIAIFRQIEGKRMGAAFDINSIRKGKMADPQVYAGDIIIVDGSNIRSIYNQFMMSLPILGVFNPILGLY
ncbi:MAG: polysaccharide export protein [Alphaproteobacteria bacterium]|nr:polysaccharide export protein [Alphaproteobacteria bacterium]